MPTVQALDALLHIQRLRHQQMHGLLLHPRTYSCWMTASHASLSDAQATIDTRAYLGTVVC